MSLHHQHPHIQCFRLYRILTHYKFFEKSWRPGGRISTRKHGEYAFDHGAHYLKIDHGMIGLNEFLEKIDAIKILKGPFCRNISQNSPIEEKEIIVGKEGNESNG